MDFEIEPEVCASEKGKGEELIEVIGDILGEHTMVLNIGSQMWRWTFPPAL